MNIKPLRQQTPGSDGSTEEQLLKLARFWLQNAFKLAAAAPSSVEASANEVLTSTLALHASMAIDVASQALDRADGAVPHASAAEHRRLSSVVLQFILPRCRFCCAAALSAKDGCALRSALEALQSCSFEESKAGRHAADMLPARLTAAAIATACKLGTPLMLAAIVAHSNTFPTLLAALQECSTVQSIRSCIAALPQSLPASLRPAQLSPYWLHTLSSDLMTIASTTPLAGDALAATFATACADYVRGCASLRALQSRMLTLVASALPAEGNQAAQLAVQRLHSSASAAAACTEAAAWQERFCICAAAAADLMALKDGSGQPLVELQAVLPALKDVLSNPALCIELAALITASQQPPLAAAEAVLSSLDHTSLQHQVLHVVQWALHAWHHAPRAAQPFSAQHMTAACLLLSILLEGSDAHAARADMVDMQCHNVAANRAAQVACHILASEVTRAAQFSAALVLAKVSV